MRRFPSRPNRDRIVPSTKLYRRQSVSGPERIYFHSEVPLAYQLLGYRLGSLLLAAFAVAGCYTGPVNMRPTVQIEPPGRVFRGQNVTYTATVGDPDGGTPTL